MTNINTDFKKAMGKRIECLRIAKGLKQEGLAKALNVSRATVSQWEAGLRAIKAANMFTIATYFGVTSDFILGLSRVPAPDNYYQLVVDSYGLSEHSLATLKKLNSQSNGAEETLQDKLNQQTLKMLNELLETPTGQEWETYGQLVLNLIHDYIYPAFLDIEQKQSNLIGTVSYTLTPDDLRKLKALQLITTLEKLRIILTETAKKKTFIKRRIEHLEEIRDRPLTNEEVAGQAELWERNRSGNNDNDT